MEFMDTINRYIPILATVVTFSFSILVYRLRDAFRKDFENMRKTLETDLKEFIQTEFLKHKNEELTETLTRKQRYIDILEGAIDKMSLTKKRKT